MKNGVDLAVSEIGGVVAGYCLEVVNLDDASPQTGKWDGAVEAENASMMHSFPMPAPNNATNNKATPQNPKDKASSQPPNKK